MDLTFTFALGVLGCRTNQEETDALRCALVGQGGVELPFPGPADIVVVNTCAVTASALAQSRQEIRRASRRLQRGRLIVTGCGAQLDPRGLANLPGVALVAGNAEKSDLPELIARLRAGSRASYPVVLHSNDPTLARFLARDGSVVRARARAALKIQDGCSSRCGYCVVSRLRGRPVSRGARDVVREAANLVASGYQEIVLTGINLGLYSDGEDERRLPDLLVELDSLPGRFRIRLSSLEPMTLDDSFIAGLSRSARLCNHIHLALQSGDDEVLARMGRPYRAEQFAEIIAELARCMPDCGLGVDIIAGYPGESPAAFERTLGLIRRLPVTYVHAFPFSPRPGTAAEKMPLQVPAGERKARVAALRRLDAELRSRFAERLRGRSCEVLVEHVDGDWFAGLSREYVRISGRCSAACAGDLLEFTPRSLDSFGLQRRRSRIAPACAVCPGAEG